MSLLPRTSRREFLTTAAALTVTAGVAPLALAAEGMSVRVAVIGTGGRGSELVRKLTTIDTVKLVAICDDYAPHLQKAATFAGKEAATFSDYKKMLTEVKPQAVVVAVPLYLHFAVCRDALEQGAAVFCEKTMCYDLDDARKLAELVAARKAVFQVGLQRRANAVYQQAKAMVDAGMIGAVTAVKAQWHRNNNWRRPVPVAKTDAQWYALEKKLNWRLYKPFSRGLMSELGSHQMDVVNWLLGVYPQRVLATGGIDYWRDGREVPDNVFCVYEYELPAPAGAADAKPYTVRATYSSLCNNAFEGASELILGTKGTLFLTEKKGLLYSERGPDDVGWAQANAGKNAAVVTAGKTLGLSNDPWLHRGKPAEIEASGDDTRDQLVSFFENVLNRNPDTICDVRTGLRNTATVLAAVTAMETGKTTELPADLRG